MQLDNGNFPNIGWVSEEGSYGWGKVVLFDPDLLTRRQWDTLDELGDSDKLPYVEAIVNGDDLSRWELDDDDYAKEEEEE